MEFIPAYGVPFVIFAARICDVSLGTLRILLVSRGLKARAALIGFVEILIWIVIIGQLIQHLNNWANYVAYAGGFAVGTYLGMTLENKLKVGTVIIRIITHHDAGELIQRLRQANVMLTVLDANGSRGAVKIILTVVRRKRWDEIVKIIESFDSDAFYSVEDVKYSSGQPSGFNLTYALSPLDRMLRIRKSI
jgi:uncharacterized protein YebE (UPF0316 family)